MTHPPTMLPAAPEDASRCPSSRRFPAWLLSIVLHLSLMMGLGFVQPNAFRSASTSREPMPEPERIVQIALRRPPIDGMSDESPVVARDSESMLPNLPEKAAWDVRPFMETEIRLPTSDDLDRDANSIVTAEAFVVTHSPDFSNESTVPTSFFGIEATGRFIVYVMDRSASMGHTQGLPMRTACGELQRSLSELDGTDQFQIIFFNERATVLSSSSTDPPRWMIANSENKSSAAKIVDRVQPGGATDPMAALELALGLDPDVIFFLTDAAEPHLTSSQLLRIRHENAGTVIHTIEFGMGTDTRSENWLFQLSRQNAGRRVYVDLTGRGDATQP